MTGTKKDILSQLQKELLVLQGFKPLHANSVVNLVPRAIELAFPNKNFPVGAVHEFISTEPSHAAATTGFVGGLLAGLMQSTKACIWIRSACTLFPPGLKSFGVEPARIVFIDVQHERDLLWAMEEALKCEGLAAVVGEIPNIDLTASRRLQLAVEKSCVTGLLLRHRPRQSNTIACVARWQISALPSALTNNTPGVGFPRWNVELLKVRNGKPGSWQLEWRNGCFQLVYKKIAIVEEVQVKQAG